MLIFKAGLSIKWIFKTLEKIKEFNLFKKKNYICFSVKGTPCLATDQHLPGVKAPPRQLRLLLIEDYYDPDPTTGEVNKWWKRKSWFVWSPEEIVT